MRPVKARNEQAVATDDRRQHARYPAAWPIRLWLSETQFFPGRAVDISLHGLKVFVQSLPAGLVHGGDAFHLEICPESSDEFGCLAVVRHVNGRELGLETRQELPARLIRRDSPERASTPEPARPS